MQQTNPSVRADPTGNVVRLAPITVNDRQMRATLTAHLLPAEQQRFVAPAVESLPLGDAGEDRFSVAIVVGEEPVGMFALDRGGYFREFDSDPQAVLLRAFYVAPQHQRRGYARAAVSAVPDFVRDQLPDVRRVVLTVNHENPAAIRTYLAGGFIDTGQDYVGGATGPQRVFELAL